MPWSAMDGVTSCAIDCISALGRARSTATVVIVLSRHLFCLLSVGRPSLVCVPPARARLMHARPPVVCLSVSPRVPFGAAQRQVFVPFSGPGTSPKYPAGAVYFAEVPGRGRALLPRAGSWRATSKESRPRTCKVPPRRSRGGTLQVRGLLSAKSPRQDHAQGTSCTSYHKNFPTEK